MASRMKFEIGGMHCAACVRRVSSALENIAGLSVESVEIGSAEIMLDPVQSPIEKVISSLHRIGFHATLAE